MWKGKGERPRLTGLPHIIIPLHRCQFMSFTLAKMCCRPESEILVLYTLHLSCVFPVKYPLFSSPLSSLSSPFNHSLEYEACMVVFEFYLIADAVPKLSFSNISATVSSRYKRQHTGICSSVQQWIVSRHACVHHGKAATSTSNLTLVGIFHLSSDRSP